MATGFLYQNQCYSTLAAATSAHWSGSPVFITSGTTSYISDVVWSGTSWVIKKYTLSSTGVLTLNSTTTAPTLSFETCETMDNFNNGLLLGWGVVAAMVAVYAIKTIRRAF